MRKTNSQRTAQTAYPRRLKHFVRLSGETGDIPHTYAHTCATLPCIASCACGSGSLPPQSKAITNQLTAHELPAPYCHLTVTRHIKCHFAKRAGKGFYNAVTVVTVKLHRYTGAGCCHSWQKEKHPCECPLLLPSTYIMG